MGAAAVTRVSASSTWGSAWAEAKLALREGQEATAEAPCPPQLDPLRVLAPEPGGPVEHEQGYEEPRPRLEGDEGGDVVEAEGEALVGAALDQPCAERVDHHEEEPGGDDEAGREPSISEDAGGGKHPDPAADLEEERNGAFRRALGEAEGDEARREEAEAEERDGEPPHGLSRCLLDRDRGAKRRRRGSALARATPLAQHRG